MNCYNKVVLLWGTIVFLNYRYFFLGSPSLPCLPTTVIFNAGYILESSRKL